MATERGRALPRWPLAAIPLLLLLLYGAYARWQVGERGLFEYVGLDYRVYRAAGEIAIDHGFSDIYDLTLQEEYQQPIYRRHAKAHGPMSMPYLTNQVVYPPVFMLPFLALPLFYPVAGFLAWAAANALLLLWASLRLVRRPGYRPDWLFWTLFLSLPLFTNLLFGQVSGWLMLFLSGFLLAANARKDFVSGMWLGGLLLKPHTLAVLAPGLLLARRWTALAGLAASTAAVAAASLALAGPAGLARMARLMFGLGLGADLTFPESMMNWRAAAIQTSGLLGTTPARAIAAVGMAATLGAGLLLWRSHPGRASLPLVTLGSWAATGAFSWHSHVHMALPLAAPLLLLLADRALPAGVVLLWSALPAAAFVLGAFVLNPGRAHDIAGMLLFALNLWLLAWSWYALRARRSPPLGDAS